MTMRIENNEGGLSIRNKLNSLLTNKFTPQHYGAAADGVTDDTAAFNAAIAAWKAEAVEQIGSDFYTDGRANAAKLVIPPGTYRVSSVNLTEIALPRNMHIEGYGAVLIANTGGKVVLDCLGSRWLNIKGLTVLSPESVEASIGLQLGPATESGGLAETCGNNAFEDLTIAGNFTRAPMVNGGSETTPFRNCQFIQRKTGANLFVIEQDGATTTVPTSDYATVSITAGREVSFTQNAFYSCQIRNEANGKGVFLKKTRTHTFDRNCYLLSYGETAVEIYQSATIENIDPCIEALIETFQGASLDHCVRFVGNGTNARLDGLTMRMAFVHCEDTLLENATGGDLTIIGANIFMSEIRGTPTFVGTGSNITLEGSITCNDIEEIVNLGDLDAFSGVVHCRSANNIASKPPYGSYIFSSTSNPGGFLALDGIGLNQQTITSVSGNEITVTDGYVVLNVTGGATINSILNGVNDGAAGGKPYIVLRNAGTDEITLTHDPSAIRLSGQRAKVLAQNESLWLYNVTGSVWQHVQSRDGAEVYGDRATLVSQSIPSDVGIAGWIEGIPTDGLRVLYVRRDSNDTVTNHCLTTADGDGWVPVADGEYTCFAEHFGDVDGTADEQQINAAIRYADEIGGGTVGLLNPEYVVSRDGALRENGALNRAIFIPSEATVTLKGRGKGLTTIKTPTGETGLYNIISIGQRVGGTVDGINEAPNVGVARGSVVGLTVEGNLATGRELDPGTYPSHTSSSHGIVVDGDGAEGVRIKDVAVKNTYSYGIGWQRKWSKDCRLEDFVIDNTGSDGLDWKVDDPDSSNGNLWVQHGKVSRVARLKSRSHTGTETLWGSGEQKAAIDARTPVKVDACVVDMSSPSDTGVIHVGIRTQESGDLTQTERSNANRWSNVTNCEVFASGTESVIGFQLSAFAQRADGLIARGCDPNFRIRSIRGTYGTLTSIDAAGDGVVVIETASGDNIANNIIQVVQADNSTGQDILIGTDGTGDGVATTIITRAIAASLTVDTGCTGTDVYGDFSSVTDNGTGSRIGVSTRV